MWINLERFVVVTTWWRVSDTAAPLTLPLPLSGMGAAGPAAGAAAYPPAEELPGLHGGGRPVHLLPWPPAPLQGAVVSRLRLLLPHQRPGRRAARQAALYHRLVCFKLVLVDLQSPLFLHPFVFVGQEAFGCQSSSQMHVGVRKGCFFSESSTACQMTVE